METLEMLHINLTHTIPMRGFLQEGDEYNTPVFCGNKKLIVKRKNKDCEPRFTKYVKKNILGITYWSFYGWYVGERNYEKTS